VLTSASAVLTTADINGGTADNVVIGGSTAAAITGTTITANTGLMPDANDGAYIGQAGTAFSDLFLAEGGVINWDSGDATLTQTGDAVDLAGAAFHTTTILTDHLGEHTAGHNIVCDNNITAPNIKAWRLIPAADFTTAPASTSTITFSVDYTTTALVGMFVRYTIGGVEYFGQLTTVAAALWTIRGATLGGNITNLYYGGGEATEIVYDGSKNPDGTALTTVLATGTVATIPWKKTKSYMVGYSAYNTVHDGGTHGKFTIKINATETNTSAGGLVIAANATWYATVIDLATAAYDVNYGEDIIFVVTVGTTGDAYGLIATATFVTP
jgi:hypothetical protein